MRRHNYTETVVGPNETQQSTPLFDEAFGLRALTPIYKGGADPEAVDPDYPFRGPALKGQLRSWWRAVHPATSVDELRHQERALFGSITNEVGKGEPRAGRVWVGLSEMSSKPARKHGLQHAAGSQLPYALWVDGKGEHEAYHLDARARLHITARNPDDDPLVEQAAKHLPAAVTAMLLFGGSGSRTRRGLGCLWSDEWLGESTSAQSLAERIGALAPAAARRPWPSLAGARVLFHNSTHSKAGKAVDTALNVLKLLRGSVSRGGSGVDRGERAPEAERDWRRVREHKPPTDAFTAALGMPLRYRMSNRHLDGETVVQPQNRDRLPSPLHVRAVPVRGKFAPVILVLRPWFNGAIEMSNHKMGPTQTGTLSPNAIDRAVEELVKRGFTAHSCGGAS